MPDTEIDVIPRIVTVRGHRVLLDADLAELYGVETKVLVRAMKRNIERFPADFMFQLAAGEWAILRSQIGTSSSGHGGRRYLPHAFTEQGVAMLSGVLRSPEAIAVNIEIMRAFVQFRRLLATNAELARRLEALESRVDEHHDAIEGHADTFREVLTAIKTLLNNQPKAPAPARKIGFEP